MSRGVIDNPIMNLMTRISLLSLAFGFFLLASCGPEKSDDALKLIAMVTLDQFQAGYLDRYDEVFTGGFRQIG